MYNVFPQYFIELSKLLYDFNMKIVKAFTLYKRFVVIKTYIVRLRSIAVLTFIINEIQFYYPNYKNFH